MKVKVQTRHPGLSLFVSCVFAEGPVETTAAGHGFQGLWRSLQKPSMLASMVQIFMKFNHVRVLWVPLLTLFLTCWVNSEDQWSSNVFDEFASTFLERLMSSSFWSQSGSLVGLAPLLLYFTVKEGEQAAERWTWRLGTVSAAAEPTTPFCLVLREHWNSYKSLNCRTCGVEGGVCVWAIMMNVWSKLGLQMRHWINNKHRGNLRVWSWCDFM